MLNLYSTVKHVIFSMNKENIRCKVKSKRLKSLQRLNVSCQYLTSRIYLNLQHKLGVELHMSFSYQHDLAVMTGQWWSKCWVIISRGSIWFSSLLIYSNPKCLQSWMVCGWKHNNVLLFFIAMLVVSRIDNVWVFFCGSDFVDFSVCIRSIYFIYLLAIFMRCLLSRA